MAKLEGVKVMDVKYGEILRVEYNGEIYEKVDDKAKDGDIVQVVDGFGKLISGDFAKVNDLNGFVYVYDGTGERAIYNGRPDKVIVFRKVAVQPSLADRVAAVEAKFNDLSSRVDKLEGKTDDGYRLVTDREPRVGDYVKFDEAPRGWLTAGKYYEIEDYIFGDPIIIDDDGDEYDTCGDEFKVYEKVPAIKETVNNISVGDYVVALPSADDCYRITNTNMKLAEVRKRLSERLISILVISHKDEDSVGDYFTVSEKHFRKATEDEIQAALKSKVRPTVGDFVKVIQNGIECTKIGDYVKIVEIDTSNVPFKCEDLDGWDVGWFREDEVEKVTDENVLKFLRIGRKPGEFKVGDLIQITKYEGGAPVGGICEVREVYNTFVLYSDAQTPIFYGAKFDAIKLVAPVEARVDRP